ncbi:MAG: adenylate/guanylate cyclase domain-containing protein [Xanthobacteraceae bacterium]|nr:adenylate/guanylate cyclase domain-containing protein [Xanthobacteraceae bacterium]
MPLLPTPPRSRSASYSDAQSLSFAEAALENAKKEGLWLAVRARWVALAAIAVTVPFSNPHWDVIYYEVILLLFALIGFGQVRVGRAGRSVPELALMFCDIALLVVTAVLHNPLDQTHGPAALQYHYPAFIYFFVLLAGGVLGYSWRTVITMGAWAAGLWIAGLAYVTWQNDPADPLSQRIRAAIGDDPQLIQRLDPGTIDYGMHIQIVVVFLIVALTLAIAARRSNALLVSHVALERSRTNLSRYFSATVVEQLSANDEPFREVRTQNVAVLFVDIIGFTRFADERSPAEVIATLRVFHGRMEQAVFEHGGTLDKYLGDGLMATFGTPFPGTADASNALRCARAMLGALDDINRDRTAAGQPPIEAGIGLHYGPVVLGDIGMNRLEFAVIGGTVNLASRLEALTRQKNCTLVASDAIIRQAGTETGAETETLAPLEFAGDQAIRGIERQVPVWVQRRAV